MAGSFGSYGAGNGQFSRPYDATVDGAGNIYVSDGANNRIQKFTSQGAFLMKFGTSGSGDGQLSNPSGIAVDAAGFIYVADRGHHRVQKFTSTGAFVAKVGTRGTGNAQFDAPSSLALDAAGNVYVADTTNNRVQKFDSKLNYLTQWGSYGIANGQFRYPTGVSVAPDGSVWVAADFALQQFSATGTFKRKVTQCCGTVSIRPRDVATNDRHVFIVDMAYRMVRYGNTPPVAAFTATPNPARIGQAVTLKSTSTDPDGTIASLAWDLDDDGAFDDATAATVTRTFTTTGTKTVRLRVVDNEGVATIGSGTVTVR